jgi:subtilisin family serine protease
VFEGPHPSAGRRRISIALVLLLTIGGVGPKAFAQDLPNAGTPNNVTQPSPNDAAGAPTGAELELHQALPTGACSDLAGQAKPTNGPSDLKGKTEEILALFCALSHVPFPSSPLVSASSLGTASGTAAASGGNGAAVLSANTSGPATAQAGQSPIRVIGPPRPPAAVPRAIPAPSGGLAGEFRDREVLVTVPVERTAREDAILGRDFGLQLASAFRSRLLGLKIVRYVISDTRTIAAVLGALVQDARVVAAQPDYVFRSVGTVASMARVPQYAPRKMRIGKAHKTARGKGIRIAIIDTAIDRTHPELASSVSRTLDALGGNATPEAHGTAIAGLLAAHAEMIGIAPQAILLSVRAFRSTGSGAAQATSFALIEALDWVSSSKARVINMSFAGPRDPLLGKAIRNATARGMIFVAAAGNGGPKAAPAFPAAYPEVIAVSATDSDDHLYAGANRGDYIAIAAPGVDIIAPSIAKSYVVQSGTSFATAEVSGVVALMLERNPRLDQASVLKILTETARPPDAKLDKSEVGAGIVDAARAVDMVRR